MLAGARFVSSNKVMTEEKIFATSSVVFITYCFADSPSTGISGKVPVQFCAGYCCPIMLIYEKTN